MSGKPKPTAIKRLNGNPGKRPLNEREPNPEKGAPEQPKWLIKEAKAEWNRIVPELERLGMLTIIDGSAIAACCQCYGRAVQAEKVISKQGLTIKTHSGYEQQRPEVAIAQKYWTIYKGYCSEFGLTPSSRSRLAVPGSLPEQDPLDKMLGTAKN